MNTDDQVVALNSTNEFERLLEECTKLKSLLLIDFYADWCGPCRAIAPQINKLAQEFSSRLVLFAKVNADHCPDLCQREFVSALPTFKLYKNGECVITVVGARIEQLQSAIEKYAIDSSILQIMKSGDYETKKSAAQNLIRIFENVIKDPPNADKRCLNLEDGVFQNCLLNVPGAMECLFAAGFQEADDCLLLPTNADIGRIKIMTEHLTCLCTEPATKSVKRATCSNRDTHESTKQPNDVSNILQVASSANWSEFVVRLLEPVKTVSAYLDPEARELARSLIPTEELIEAAAIKSGCNCEAITPRAFLRELLRWYKEDFFRWADSFECVECQSKMKFQGAAAPNPQERLGRPGVVELYKCAADPSHPAYRFPRYNDVKTLLRTRLGRCGEWANCLTLILSSCSRLSKSSDASEGEPWFPACRYVADWTDHVWCEVWLEDEQTPGTFRWVHCDPGGEVDQPLLYEQGWGKKLTYVFAYTVPPIPRVWSSDIDEVIATVDIQDVTWRYTRNFQEVVSRRHRALEPRLAKELTLRHLSVSSKWHKMPTSLLPPSHPFSLQQIVRELSSFLVEPKLPVERLPGRQTGSLEWRKARGELGSEDPTPIWHGSNLPLRPTSEELKHGMVFVRYNAALDIYQRPCMHDAASEVTLSRSNVPRNTEAMISEAKRLGLKGWQSLATRWRNISRKVERDWHMVYLAREEDSLAEHDGVIEWVLDLHGTGYTVGRVSLFANMVCHTSDCDAQFTLCSESQSGSAAGASCVRLVPGSNALFQVTDFNGAKCLRLTGSLWSKNTNTPSTVAWQQSQLFRQKDTDSVLWPLEWKVELVREESLSSPEIT